MNIEITVLIAVVGCLSALAGWLSGRDKKISGESKWRGSVDAKLDAIMGIKQDVKVLEEKSICRARGSLQWSRVQSRRIAGSQNT